MENLMFIVYEALLSVFKLSLIVIPLMIVIELMREYKIIDKISKFLKPITNFLKISEKGAFPLTVGLIFGLSYGAGVIIQSAKDDNIDRKTLIVVSVYLSAAHAIFEDTLLFMAVGANGIYLLSIRLIFAFAISLLISKMIDKKVNVL
jgi:hypothetical protein